MIGDIEQVLEALERRGVRYLVTGGVASVLHGHLRTTAALDLILERRPHNVRRAVRALTRLGYRPRSAVEPAALAEPETQKKLVRENGGTVTFWSPRAPNLDVEILLDPPYGFPALHARALRVGLRWTEATVVGLDDLIDLKRIRARPVDVEDANVLEARRPVESLRWLEETMDELRCVLGRARKAKRAAS